MVEIAERGMHSVIPIVRLLRCELDYKSSHKAKAEKRDSRPYQMFIEHAKPSPMTPFKNNSDSILEYRSLSPHGSFPRFPKARKTIHCMYKLFGKKSPWIQPGIKKHFLNHISYRPTADKDSLSPVPCRKDSSDQLIRIR